MLIFGYVIDVEVMATKYIHYFVLPTFSESFCFFFFKD